MRRLENWALGLTLVVLFSGCVTPPPPDSNTNTNSGNGNLNSGNNNTNSAPLDLTTEQKNTINQCVPLLDELGAGLSTLSGLSDSQLDPNNIPQFLSFGVCPSVIVLGDAGDTRVLALTFGPSGTGCASPKTAGVAITGTVGINPFNRATKMGGFQLENVTFDGLPVGLTATLTLSGDVQTGITLGLSGLTLTVGDFTASGSMTVDIDHDGVITLDAADLTIADGANSFIVDLLDVVIDPAGNSSLVPEGGTAVIGQGSGALQVTFDSQTPATGVVQVSVEGVGSTTYDVPGIGS